MIKVNLAKGRKTTSGSGSSGSFDISGLFAKLKGSAGAKGEASSERASSDFDWRKSHLVSAVALGLVGYLATGIVEERKRDELTKVKKQQDKVVADTKAVTDKLAQMRGFEKIKKQLEDDERTVRTKLEVIAKLLDNRDGPSRLMLQLARTIPEEVWISNLQVNKDGVKVTGSTFGLSQVSDFLRALNETPMLSDVNLGNTQEQQSKDKGAKLQIFDVTARHRM